MNRPNKITITGVFSVILGLYTIAFIYTPLVHAARSDDDKIDAISRNLTLNYGPAYLVQDVLNKPAENKAGDDVELKKAIDKNARAINNAAGDNEKLDLKGPKGDGGPDRAKVETEAVITIPVDLPIDLPQPETPVEKPPVEHVIPQALIDYLNERQVANYEIVFCDDRIQVVWDNTDSSTGMKSVRMRVFDYDGIPHISSGEVIIAEDRVLNKVIGLSNGNMVIVYSRIKPVKVLLDGCIKTVYDTTIRILDKDSGMINSLQGLSENKVMSSYNVGLTPNGDIYIIWKSLDVAGQPVSLHIFSKETGREKGAFLMEGSYARFDKVVALSKGKMAVFWVRYNTATSSSNDLVMQLIDESGNKYGSEHSIPLLGISMETYPSTGRNSTIISLSNGNMAIFFSSFLYETTDHISRVWMHIIDSEGDDIVSSRDEAIAWAGSKDNIMDYASSGRKEWWLAATQNAFMPQFISVTIAPDNRIAVLWAERSTNPGASSIWSLKMTLLDSTARMLINEQTLFNDRPMRYEHLDSIRPVFLSNNRLVVAWKETIYDYASHEFDSSTLKLQSFHMELNSRGEMEWKGLAEERTLFGAAPSLHSGVVERIIALQNGNIAVVYYDSSNEYIVIEILDDNGITVPLYRRTDNSVEEINNIAIQNVGSNAVNEIIGNTLGEIDVALDDGMGHKINSYTTFDPRAIPDPIIPEIPEISEIPEVSPNIIPPDMNYNTPYTQRPPTYNLRSDYFDPFGKSMLERSQDDLNSSGLLASLRNNPGGGMQGDNYLFDLNKYLIANKLKDMERDMIASFESYMRVPAKSAVLGQERPLEAMILSLDAKPEKTGLEEHVLDISKAVMVDSGYIDQETLEEFQEAMRAVLIAESMKSVIESFDFRAIEDILTVLVKEQKSLYLAYTRETEKAYDEIINLLGIDAESGKLPDSYAFLYDINPIAKKRILVDITLNEIRTKDPSLRTDAEKKALKLEGAYNLGPLRQRYIGMLKSCIQRFASTIRELLKDSAHASTSRSKESFKALFYLNKNPATPSN